MILTDLFESQEIHNQDRLDQVLARCIEMVHEKNQANPKKYGKVAACIIDMKNRKVFGINSPGANGTRRHAERMAIDAYHKRYGKILPGAIIVTTLSPCNRDMAERDGPSCQDLLLQAGIEKVYSGYMDPSQHSEHPFTEETTQNDDLWRRCKEFSDSFVHDDLTESQHNTITADQVLDYVKQAHAPEAFDIEYSITDHPEWELTNIPLSQLNLDPDGEAQDPYNRVNWVDDDKVQELIPRIGSVLKSNPIVVDPEGWIIDGNHRAVAAAEAGLTSVPALVPVKQGMAEGKLVESAVFLNPTTVVVGQAHGQSLELSPDTLKKIQAIAAKHGAWYEGNGTDRSYTKGQIDRYVGSWDDEVAKTASPNDPKWLYVLFANVDENNRVQRVGVDPKDTIFNRLLTTAQDNSFQGIGYTSQALQNFLQMASEGKYDFIKMSQQPATQENLTRFLKAGEALMWPSNWEQYPNRAGKIAKSATVDVRDQYLATRKAGVYVTGSGHLKAVQNITGKQGVAESKQPGKSVTDAIQKVLPIAQEIWFHGSRATGSHRRNSDTDILVVIPDDLVGDQYLAVVRILQKLASHFDNYDIQPTKSGTNIHRIAQEEGRLLWSSKQGVAENFHDGENPVKFTVSSPDGYQHSFQITLAVHGKHVGHFNFVRSADTDDVNNEAEVEQRWQGQGYGKLLLMKAIDVANNHGLDFQQDIRGITDAQQNVYDSLENAGLIVTPGDGFWFLTPQGEQELNGLNENFADGKNPGRKGLSKRVGVNTKASVSSLRKTAKHSTGEKARMAHWLANMKAGRARARKK